MLDLAQLSETILGRNRNKILHKIEGNQEAKVKIGQIKNINAEVGKLNLDDGTILTRFYGIEGEIKYSTFKVYVDGEDEQVKVFDASCQPIKVEKFIEYQLGIGGYQIVQIGEIQIKVPLSIKEDFRKEFISYSPEKKAEVRKTRSGKPKAEFLQYPPHPTVPLRNLNEGEIYKVLKKTGVDKNHNNANRYLVEDATGEQFEVLGTKSLEPIQPSILVP